MSEPLEPAHRIVPEPTDDQGKPLGWRAADLTDADLVDDEFIAADPDSYVVGSDDGKN